MQTVHIIYRSVPNDRVSDANEVVGVVLTGWEDADRVVERLNEEEKKVRGGFSWHRYVWKRELPVLTPEGL